jgi:hypothetical protein
MMTEKERDELAGIDPEMLPAPFYFRAFSGKRSFAPPAEQSDWFRRESLTLANGDNVWVAVLWKYPASQDAVPPEIVKDIVAEINQGMPNGVRYSNHPSATARPAWPIVQKHCPGKTERQCRKLIAGWIKRGLLYEERYFDQDRREEVTGLFTHAANQTGQSLELPE